MERLVPVYALTLAGTISASTLAADNIPARCCPNSCEIATGAMEYGTASGRTRRTGIRQNGEFVPLSRNIYLGESPDDRARICIGFDTFGNKEVKCMFTPAIM
jgi:hypothetical protein